MHIRILTCILLAGIGTIGCAGEIAPLEKNEDTAFDTNSGSGSARIWRTIRTCADTAAF